MRYQLPAYEALSREDANLTRRNQNQYEEELKLREELVQFTNVSIDSQELPKGKIFAWLVKDNEAHGVFLFIEIPEYEARLRLRVMETSNASYSWSSRGDTHSCQCSMRLSTPTGKAQDVCLEAFHDRETEEGDDPAPAERLTRSFNLLRYQLSSSWFPAFPPGPIEVFLSTWVSPVCAGLLCIEWPVAMQSRLPRPSDQQREQAAVLAVAEEFEIQPNEETGLRGQDHDPTWTRQSSEIAR